MPKTVQIRDLDDEVYAGLQRHAAAARISVPELLRREATRLAARETMHEWLERVSSGPPLSTSTSDEIIAIMDEWRGPWPDADH